MKFKIGILGLFAVALTATAGVDDADYDFFGFRISAGYQMGINLNSSFRTSIPAASSTKAAAYARATGADGTYRSDDGGFIVKDDGGGDPTKTTYWQVPSGAATVDGANTAIALVNSFQDGASFSSSDDAVAHGAHVELSATVGRDGDWGLDLFVGFAWMTGINCYEARGNTLDNAGAYRTLANVSSADLWAQGYIDDYGYATGDTMGPGRPWQMGDGPQLSTDLGTPSLLAGSGATSYSAEGDYNEYDIYGGMRLWYADEEYQWFKVTSTIGFGVDYGEFDYEMTASGPNGFAMNHSFRDGDWDLYGLLGLGIMIDCWDWTLSFDALWRYGQNALEINSPFVRGEIERPDFIFRASLGYNF